MSRTIDSLEAEVEQLEQELQQKLIDRYVPKFHDCEKVVLCSGKWRFEITKHRHVLQGVPFWKILGSFRGRKDRHTYYYWSPNSKLLKKLTGSKDLPDREESNWLIKDKKDLEHFYEYAQFQLPKTTPTEEE